MKASYTDDKIVEIIRKGNSKECDSVLKHLYQNCYPQIRNYVLKNSGREDESKDLFQEVLITFYNQIRENKFKGGSAIGTYLYSIARFSWMNELRKRKVTYVSVSENHAIDEEVLDDLLSVKSHVKLFTKLFELLKPGCKEILTLAYYNGLNTAELQDKLDLGSVQSVRTKKFRCLQKLTDIFKKHKITKDHFTY